MKSLAEYINETTIQYPEHKSYLYDLKNIPTGTKEFLYDGKIKGLNDKKFKKLFNDIKITKHYSSKFALTNIGYGFEPTNLTFIFPLDIIDYELSDGYKDFKARGVSPVLLIKGKYGREVIFQFATVKEGKGKPIVLAECKCKTTKKFGESEENYLAYVLNHFNYRYWKNFFNNVEEFEFDDSMMDFRGENDLWALDTCVVRTFGAEPSTTTIYNLLSKIIKNNVMCLVYCDWL